MSWPSFPPLISLLEAWAEGARVFKPRIRCEMASESPATPAAKPSVLTRALDEILCARLATVRLHHFFGHAGPVPGSVWFVALSASDAIGWADAFVEWWSEAETRAESVRKALGLGAMPHNPRHGSCVVVSLRGCRNIDQLARALRRMMEIAHVPLSLEVESSILGSVSGGVPADAMRSSGVASADYPTFTDAVALVDDLKRVAAKEGVSFAILVTEELPDGERTEKASSAAAGRKQARVAAIRAARAFLEEFHGHLVLLYEGAADVAASLRLMEAGMSVVMLPDAYWRECGLTSFAPYLIKLEQAMRDHASEDLAAFACRVASRASGFARASCEWACGYEQRICARLNLQRYLEELSS